MATTFTDFFQPSLDELQLMNSQLYMYGLGGFTAAGYWSSFEYINAPYQNAMEIDFSINTELSQPKGNTYRVRACHTFDEVDGAYAVRDKGKVGGYIFYIESVGGGMSKYYEAALTDVSASYVWSNVVLGGDITYQGIGYGKPNSDAIIAQVGHTTSAALLCENLSLTGWTGSAPTGLTITADSGGTFTLNWHGTFSNGLQNYAIDYWNGSIWTFYGTVGSGITSTVITSIYDRWRVGAADGFMHYYFSTSIYRVLPPSGLYTNGITCNHFVINWTNNNTPDTFNNMVQTYYSGSWHDLTITYTGVTNSSVYVAPNTIIPVRVGVILPDTSRIYSIAITGSTATMVAPTALTATVVGATIVLNWINTTTNGLEIDITRRIDYGAPVLLGHVGISANTYTDTGVMAGHHYVYQVVSNCSNTYYFYSNYASKDMSFGYIAHDPLDSDIFLRFNNSVLYDLEITDFEINFQLTDIKNLSAADTSFTLPIKIPYSPASRAIFGSLFNVNNSSISTDVKLPCKLIYHNKTIIDGYAYVYFSDPNYINVVVARNDLGIFQAVGNLVLSDLILTGGSYNYHNQTLYNNYIIGDNLINPDRQYALIDWWGAASKIPNRINKGNFSIYPSPLVQNYPTTPTVKVKTIFDKIFSTQGYSYIGSTKFTDILANMYMTTTSPRAKYSQNVDTKYYFSPDSSYGTAYTIKTFNASAKTSSVTTHTFCAYTDIIYGVSKMLGNIVYYNTSDVNNFNIPFFSGVESTITLSLYGYGTSVSHSGITSITIQKIVPNPAGTSGTTLVDVVALTPIVFNSSSSIKNYQSVTKFTPDDTYNLTDKYVLKIENGSCVPLIRQGQTGFVDTCLTVTTPNYVFYTGNTYTLTDLLPSSYTQFDFLNDIFNMFNIYIYADKVNNKLLHLETFADFYTQEVLDWSDKITLDKLEIYDTSQQVYSQYQLTNAAGSDKIGKAYNTYSGLINNEKDIFNTNELAINNIQTIQISTPQGNLTQTLDMEGFVSGASTNMTNRRMLAPVFSYIDKENSACIFGFIGTFGSNTAGYYLQVNTQGFNPNTYTWGMELEDFLGVAYYQTFLPFWNTFKSDFLIDFNWMQLFFQDPNTFALLFKTNDSFLTSYYNSGITDNNLYRFWQNDIESKIFSNQKFLKISVRLKENDVDVTNFKKKIWIDNPKLGGAYYRLNKIIFPSDPKKIGYAEMVSELNYSGKTSGTTLINILNYDQTNDQVNFIRNGSTPAPDISHSDISFYGPDLYSVLIQATNTDVAHKTYTALLSYQLTASVVSTSGSESATTTFQYSIDGGSTWRVGDSVTSSVLSAGSNSQTKNGTINFVGITDFSVLAFKGTWDYSTGSNSQSGGYQLTITSGTITWTTSYPCTISIATPSHAQAGGPITVPYLT